MTYRGMSKDIIRKNIKRLAKMYGQKLTEEENDKGLDEDIGEEDKE